MAWRLAAGLTQAELADSVRRIAADAGSPCSPSTPSCQQISRWENGHDKPGAFYQVLLARWYRTDPVRLGLLGDVRLLIEEGCLSAGEQPSAVADQEDDVNRRNFLAVVAAPVLFQLDQVRRRMDADLRHALPPAEADQWAQIAAHHVAAYGVVPPATLLERLAPDLSDLADLVGQYPQQRELTRLAARLCGLTGALHTDLGNDRAARDWLHTASRYAAMSGDVATAYWIAMAQAMTATYPADPQRVLVLADRATSELGPHPCAAAAQLTGLAARAHAELGGHHNARTVLASAERIAASLTSEQADELFFGFPGRQMRMYTARVLAAVGDPAAWSAQADALSCYPDGDPMDRPLILLDRARYLAKSGHADHASRIAIDAITAIAPAWRVALLASEARSVGKSITAVSAQVGRQYARTLSEALPA